MKTRLILSSEKACGNSLSKSDFEKLLATGSNPANFYVKIKDHKNKNDNVYPLRPIASSIGTPTCKVDWIVTKMLSQLVQFVHTNITNSLSLIDDLKNLTIQLRAPSTFISLDVSNLYPSIPLQHGVEVVSSFLKTHWNDIDNDGLKYDDITNCLNFLCYNYYIQYNNVTYRQIKGCPMGARFSPPFAIIYMYHIEKIALNKLEKDHNIIPQYYGRYIDDIIIGPFVKHSNCITKITNTFNSVSNDIKFTVEIPNDNSFLNFLDISIAIENNVIEYQWYTKELHSGNSLNKQSWVPNHIKSNYIRNSRHSVTQRCSDSNKKDSAMSKLNQRFKNNGFSDLEIRNIKYNPNHKKKSDNRKTVSCKINYISDSCNRKLNKLIKQCDLPIRLVSKPGPKLESVINKKQNRNKHTNCHLCGILPRNYSCSDRFVVYKLTCNFCNECYIGQTNRPFNKRYHEHKRDIKNKNKKNALYEHGSKIHNYNDIDLSHFDLDIIDISSNAVDCRLSEARFIKLLKPSINRKHELPNF